MIDERDLPSLKVVGIFTSPAMGAPMVSHQTIRAIPGEGLEGDRYAERQGAYSDARIRQKNPNAKQGRIPDEDRQVSLISTGGIQAANEQLAEKKVPPFDIADTRRNLIVEMTAEELRYLVGRTFRVCNVLMQGVEECTPCKRPAQLAGRKEDGELFESTFEQRGGLRARVLSEGVISVAKE